MKRIVIKATRIFLLLGLALPLVMLSCSEKGEGEETTTDPVEPLPDMLEIDGIYYNVLSETRVEVTSGERAYSGDIVIPETVTYGEYTFSVYQIDEYAFSDCSELTSIDIPESVRFIQHGAFSSCTGLMEVVIPNRVMTLGIGVFKDCTGLTDVTVGDRVEGITERSFYGCTRLKNVTIGNKVSSIGDRAFYGCDSLEEVIIPDSVTSIGPSAFSNCTSLARVTIGNNVTSIGLHAFLGCGESLRELSLPASVTSIGEYAFYDCRFDKFYSFNPEPPICGDFNFYVQQSGQGVLYVPAGSKEAYSVADEWKYFQSIEEMD